VAGLEKTLQKSEDWLHFSSDPYRDSRYTSLRLSARDPAAADADPERAEWIFPVADGRPGG
jgi:hypothetical protein